MNVKEKECSRCGEVKPLAAFHRNKASRDGRIAACRVCRSTSKRKYKRWAGFDITGKKFAHLTAIRPATSGKHNHTRWLFRCDCGNEKPINVGKVVRGRRVTCGCRVGQRSDRPSVTKAINRYRTNAKRRGLAWGLTKAEAIELLTSVCHYCGGEPSMVTDYGDHGGPFCHGGIDRMNNDKGYTPENCVPCCTICNYAKVDLPYEEFIDWLNQVARYRAKGGVS